MISLFSELLYSASVTMAPQIWWVLSSLYCVVETDGQAWTLYDSLKNSTNML